MQNRCSLECHRLYKKMTKSSVLFWKPVDIMQLLKIYAHSKTLKLTIKSIIYPSDQFLSNNPHWQCKYSKSQISHSNSKVGVSQDSIPSSLLHILHCSNFTIAGDHVTDPVSYGIWTSHRKHSRAKEIFQKKLEAVALWSSLSNLNP